MRFTKPTMRFFIVSALLLQLSLVHCGGAGGGKIPITTSSDEALEHFLRGRDLLEGAQTPQAHRHFQRAVKADAEFALGYLYLSFANPSAKGFFENLRLARSYSAGVSEGERLIIEGIEAGANGDMAKEVELFQRLVSLYPNDERAHMFLANQYFGQQDYKLAVAEYEAVVDIAPEFAPPYNMLGYCYRSLNDYAAASRSFEEYIRLIPDDPNPYDSHAELLMRMGKFEDAITRYRKALELDPAFGASWVGIASNLVFLGRHDEAREVLAEFYENAVDIGQHRAALFVTAVTYVDEGDMDAALRELRRQYALADSIEDAAAMSRALANIAFVQLEAHRPADAEKSLNQALELVEKSDLFEKVKRNSRLDHILGEALILLEKGEPARAGARAEEYLSKVEPLGNPFRIRNAHLVLGRIALRSGEYDRAIAELKQANQQQAWTLYHLGLANEAKGELDVALRLYRDAAQSYQLHSLTYAAVRQKAEQKMTEMKQRLFQGSS